MLDRCDIIAEIYLRRDRKLITFVLGGARSGKSARAEEVARASSRPRVVYIATAEKRAEDDEMASRIQKHRVDRPSDWETWEGEPNELAGFVSRERDSVMLLDCITMLLARIAFSDSAMEDATEAEWSEREREILDVVDGVFCAVSPNADLIAVSNEVGWGIVPEGRLSRRFRDMQGRANAIAAKRADSVELVVAGIPVKIK